MTCCCLEIIIAAVLNRFLGIIIVLRAYFNMSHIEEREKFFHSCLNKNKDGSNRLFEKDDRCCIPANSPFWKRPWDVTRGVRTRAQEKEQKKVNVEENLIDTFKIYGLFNGG